MKKTAVAFLTLTLIICAASRPARGDYGAGFVWDRSVDYDEGTTYNSTDGNPNTDAEGNAVWQYEYVPVGNAVTWYQTAGSKMEWDNSWFGGAAPGATMRIPTIGKMARKSAATASMRGSPAHTIIATAYRSFAG